jgi:Zinc knuckle
MTTSSAPPAQKQFFFPEKKDPNAMDINRMLIKERTHLIKEGKCFRCKLLGHLSRDCPNKGQNTTNTPKWTGKSTAAHIQTLIALMSEEEKKVLEEEGEKFGLGF